MTCKYLITYCITNDGKCVRCRFTKYCEAYKAMFNGDIPLDDDDHHPERFTSQKINLEVSK